MAQASKSLPYESRCYDEPEKAKNDDERGVRVWLRQTARSAQRGQTYEQTKEGKRAPAVYSLLATRAADDLCAAPEAHPRARGDLGVAMWANQLLHPGRIPAGARAR